MSAIDNLAEPLLRGLTRKQCAILVERHPCSDWKHEVANDDTKLGFEEWLVHHFEADQHDGEEYAMVPGKSKGTVKK